jgi:hypothetical protein
VLLLAVKIISVSRYTIVFRDVIVISSLDEATTTVSPKI